MIRACQAPAAGQLVPATAQRPPDIAARQHRELRLLRLDAALDTISDALVLIDPGLATLLEVNAAACRLFGASRSALLALTPAALLGRPPAELQQAWQALMVGTCRSASFEVLHHCADGRLLPLAVQRTAVATAEGWLIVELLHDTAASQRVAKALQRQAAQHRLLARFGQTALENPPLPELMTLAIQVLGEGLKVGLCRLLAATDDDATLLQTAASGWSEACMLQTHFDAAAETQNHFVLGARESVVVTDFAAELRFQPSASLLAHGVRSAVEALICGPSGAHGVIGAYSPEGHRFNVECADFVQSIANTLAAAIERNKAEDRLSHLAQFDVLTGLPNRGLYLDRLGHSLVEAERDRRPVGVLFVDIDRFKCINDTFGHATGDALLVEVARRLQSAVRTGDTVGRLGGDEFAVALAHLACADDAALVAQKMVSALAEVFRLDAHEVYVSASIGIAIHPSDGRGPDELLQNADTAMYRAKEAGRNAYQFYLAEMNERVLVRMRIESQLRGALARGEFLLHYQPKLQLSSGRICGLEALLRWQPPGRSLIPPGEFIAILEDTGLIVAVGEWVLATVCQQIAGWQAEGLSVLPVAVNVSARQFGQKNLTAMISDLLNTHQVDPALLEIELTESSLMGDSAAAVQTLRELKACGMRISVDDFGTGYSSLAYLKRFRLDALKIDREFIRDVTTDADAAAIVLAILSLAGSLKLKVVAEGVETEAQLAFLHSHGCDEIQGYLFSRPLPADEVKRLLAQPGCLVWQSPAMVD